MNTSWDICVSTAKWISKSLINNNRQKIWIFLSKASLDICLFRKVSCSGKFVVQESSANRNLSFYVDLDLILFLGLNDQVVFSFNENTQAVQYKCIC